MLFFHIDFFRILEPTWMDLGAQIGAQKADTNSLFSKLRSRGVQEASKRCPRAPKSIPRAPQERSRAPQERPRASQERPTATRERPKCAQGAPKCHQRGTCWCISVCFPAFFHVFICCFVFLLLVFLRFLHFKFVCVFLRFW